MLHFSTLDLCQPILAAIKEEGYETLTPIQAQAIVPALTGRDILACAPTGTGKTAAFALPILHRLHTAAVDKTRRGPVLPRVLVLSPTRELANQIEESFASYGRHTGLRTAVVYGGVSQLHQVRALNRGVDILVATPGRLQDLMQQKVVDLRNVEIFVLDEADRMLDMGFIQPIRQIASVLKKERQTLLFSATMPSSIMHLADSLLKDPVKVSVAVAKSEIPLIEQSVYMVQRGAKVALLEHLLEEQSIDRAIVFTRTKHGADKLTKKLNASGVLATAIHGNKAQNQRQRALDGFRNGRTRVLVATDVAARGIDVDNITHVFNFDLPNEPEAYVHRIGRTGRAGSTGLAISFCDRDERGFLRAIERLTGKRIDVAVSPTNLKVSEPVEEDRPMFNTFVAPKRDHPRTSNTEVVGRHNSAPHQRPTRGPVGAPAGGRKAGARPGVSSGSGSRSGSNGPSYSSARPSGGRPSSNGSSYSAHPSGGRPSRPGAGTGARRGGAGRGGR